MKTAPSRITFIGHSTLAIDMDGIRVLTDPLLRDRLAHLHRHVPAPDPEQFSGPDVVLISHAHLDHLDVPSLMRLGIDRHVIIPAGAGQILRRRGFTRVTEIEPGETVSAAPIHITATPAHHSGFRPPVGPRALAMGFLVTGSLRVYFAGDTNLFPQMADLGGEIDVALLPVWGWGRALGPGHLNPERAAEALTMLRPRLAIPIHWGTFAARGVRKRDPDFLTEPPIRFAKYAAELAPEVAVKVLEPGQAVAVAPNGAEE